MNDIRHAWLSFLLAGCGAGALRETGPRELEPFNLGASAADEVRLAISADSESVVDLTVQAPEATAATRSRRVCERTPCMISVPRGRHRVVVTSRSSHYRSASSEVNAHTSLTLRFHLGEDHGWLPSKTTGIVLAVTGGVVGVLGMSVGGMLGAKNTYFGSSGTIGYVTGVLGFGVSVSGIFTLLTAKPVHEQARVETLPLVQ